MSSNPIIVFIYPYPQLSLPSLPVSNPRTLPFASTTLTPTPTSPRPNTSLWLAASTISLIIAFLPQHGNLLLWINRGANNMEFAGELISTALEKQATHLFGASASVSNCGGKLAPIYQMFPGLRDRTIEIWMKLTPRPKSTKYSPFVTSAD